MVRRAGRNKRKLSVKKIPFYKPSIGDDEIREVVDTLKSGWLTTGPKVKQFEKTFSDYLGRKHAIGLNSCTGALHLVMEALGIGERDTVVVPTMTFAATAEVVRYVGARPLLVDCRESDFNLDVADARTRVEKAVESGANVKAIIPVHFAGQVGDVGGVASLASDYDLKIVEDAAHCCPAYYRPSEEGQWQPVGASADITCFSFYANKTITTGEGGMACTDSDDYADRMRIMSLHGICRDAWKRYCPGSSWYYEIIAPGYKYNMADISASIGIHQLRAADRLFARRASLAARYSSNLAEVDELVLPSEAINRKHSWHLYVIRLRKGVTQIDRNELILELNQRGVGTSVHFTPLHMHPYYRETYGYQRHDCPESSRLYDEIVTLPLYPEMSDEDIDYVCESIRDILNKHQLARVLVR